MVLEVTTRWIANGRVRLLPLLAIRGTQPLSTPSRKQNPPDWLFVRNTL